MASSILDTDREGGEGSAGYGAYWSVYGGEEGGAWTVGKWRKRKGGGAVGYGQGKRADRRRQAGGKRRRQSRNPRQNRWAE